MVHPLATNGEEESRKDSTHVHRLLDSLVAFYPTEVASSNELMLDTNQMITSSSLVKTLETLCIKLIPWQEHL